MRHGVQISKDHLPKTLKDRLLMEKITYALVTESIMYAMLYARLDAAFAQSVTSIFHVNPSKRDWEALKSILRYLRSTSDLFVVYGRE